MTFLATQKISKLFRIRGGVHPHDCKTLSADKAIEDLPMPSLLHIPLQQHIGAAAKPAVKRGDHVLKGQLLANSQGMISAPIHAPTSGRVVGVGHYPAHHASGLSVHTITLQPDGKDEWIAHGLFDYAAMTPEAVREHLQQSGVVGLGGAAFPTHGKLTASKTVPMDELIINGAECEPFITCDDLLMRERAEEVVRGIGIFRVLLQP